MVTEILRLALLLLHGLAGAAWFGSIFYSLFVLYPRASAFFDKLAERERFFLALSHGARWHMIAALSLVGLSGVGLVALASEPPTSGKLILWGAKAVLLIVSAVLFWRVSWYWWPARLFALEPELPALHRRFRVGAGCMMVLVSSNIILGIVSRYC